MSLSISNPRRWKLGYLRDKPDEPDLISRWIIIDPCLSITLSPIKPSRTELCTQLAVVSASQTTIVTEVEHRSWPLDLIHSVCGELKMQYKPLSASRQGRACLVHVPPRSYLPSWDRRVLVQRRNSAIQVWGTRWQSFVSIEQRFSETFCMTFFAGGVFVYVFFAK
jgi:hypothetical protein